jgi:iron complex outermembrane receptor protein
MPSVLPSSAAEGDSDQPPIVVRASALPGTAIDIDKIPGTIQTLRASDLSRDGSASLARALDSQLGSISISDNLDDPFQPDILYRGFEASPVLGTPQGLAVYQNGVRINEAFGDTVNWDLIPDIAIDRVDIVTSNPVYGLNALGGAISVNMKNGFHSKDAEIEASGGSFGQRALAAQYGASSGTLGIYAAGRVLNETGWRQFSNDAIRQLYAVASARSDNGSLDLAYAHADNTMNGQGAAPVQELAVNRSFVFTGPQSNLNRLDFVTLNGAYDLAQHLSLQGALYYRQYGQGVANGNTTNYVACTNGANAGLLCQPDGTTPVTNAAGAALPDISQGGTVPIGENDVESIHAYGRGATLQASDAHAILDHGNQFTAGASLDYATVGFYSGAQVGVINSRLLVQPSQLIVDTTEAQQNAALAAGDPNVSVSPVSLQAANRQYGFYATDTFDVTADLAVTASARFNLASIDLRDQRGANLTGDNRYRHLNPALGATYKVSPIMTVYGGVSQNTRTPTASEIECSNPFQPCLLPSNLAGDPPTLRQVVAHTTELGLRGVLGDGASTGRWLWNLSAFRTQLDDDIYGIATSVSRGFFQNIGATRRQGVEAGLNYQVSRWSAFANYSYVEATFESPLTLPSPSNPFQDADGNIHVQAGDRLPGIPQHRLKAGVDYRIVPEWSVGGTVNAVSSFHYFGDESNQLAPVPGHRVVGARTSYRAGKMVEVFASVSNLFNAKYANYGILSDPTGVGAPGIAANGVTNGPGVDNRFQSPAAPIAAFGGVRLRF